MERAATGPLCQGPEDGGGNALGISRTSGVPCPVTTYGCSKLNWDLSVVVSSAAPFPGPCCWLPMASPSPLSLFPACLCSLSPARHSARFAHQRVICAIQSPELTTCITAHYCTAPISKLISSFPALPMALIPVQPDWLCPPYTATTLVRTKCLATFPHEGPGSLGSAPQAASSPTPPGCPDKSGGSPAFSDA